MLNISLISKDKVGDTKFRRYANCDVRIGNLYRVGKLIATFCFITCKVLATE